MSVYTIGSLCSGYGGLDMAVEAVTGGRTAWVSDIDKGACKVLAHRYPNVPNIGDMTAVDWSTVEPVDVLTGGTPCQDLSHAGARKGMTAGTRSNLWVSMREAVATLRPGLVVWENVAGAYSAAADSEMESREGRLGDGSGGPVLRALGRVLGDLASLGYVGGWHGLRAADVGAPHGRLRVFVVAWPIGNPSLRGRDATQLAGQRGEPAGATGGSGGPALLPTPRATDGTKGGPNQRGSSGDLMLPSAVAKMLPTPTTRDHKDHTIRREPHRPDDTDTLARALTDVPAALLPTPAVNDMGRAYTPDEWDAWCAKQREAHGNGNGHGKSLEIEAQRLLPTPTAQTFGTQHGKDPNRQTVYSLEAMATKGMLECEPTTAAPTAVRTSKTDPTTTESASRGTEPSLAGPYSTAPNQWGDYAAAIARWEQTLGRPAPAPTMLSAKGNPQLSPAFTEWMMGLPAGWITDTPGITRNEALKLCGNGVVPQQAATAIRYLLNVIGEQVAA